jgi:hypothetical protein
VFLRSGRSVCTGARRQGTAMPTAKIAVVRVQKSASVLGCAEGVRVTVNIDAERALLLPVSSVVVANY